MLLYELLTGSTPLERERCSHGVFLESLRLVREEEPPRPSTRLSTSRELVTIAANRRLEPKKLSGLIRGELDWIVMKCLEKDRSRRYETASGLANDLQHYFADEPVQAYPPSASYRFRKFTRRHKRAIVLATLGCLMLLITVSSVAWTIGWAARDRAALRARLAGQAEVVLSEAEIREHEQSWPEALDAARRASVLAAEADDAELCLRVNNLLAELKMVQELESIRLQVSEMKHDHFDYAAADRSYAAVFRKFGLDVEQLSTEEGAERIRSRPGIALPLTASMDHWAMCRGRAQGWENIGTLTMMAQAADPDSLRRQMRAALLQQDWKNLNSLADTQDTAYLPPSSLILLSSALRAGGHFRISLEVLRKGQREYPADFWLNFHLAHASANAKPPRLDDAVSFYRAALAARPNNDAVYNNLGNALSQKGDLDEAIACHRKAISHHPENAMSHYNLGVRLQLKGERDEAIAAYREAIRIEPNYSQAYHNLGAELQDRGETDEAIDCYRKAIQLDPTSASGHYNLALVLKSKGRLDEAITSYRTALEFQQDFAACHNNLGVALDAKGNSKEAIASYRKAIFYKPSLISAHNNLGAALKDKGELSDSIACYRQALRLKKDSAIAQAGLPAALNLLACAWWHARMRIRRTFGRRRRWPKRLWSECPSRAATGTRLAWCSTAPAIGRKRLSLWKNRERYQAVIRRA